MKISPSVLCVLLAAGCATSKHRPVLSPELAKTICWQLANVKSENLYHCHPFLDDRPAQFVGDHWVWSDLKGAGQGDIQATVELAPDGTTNRVDIKMLVNQAPPTSP